MGVHVIPYTKFIFADTRTERFRNELNQYASRDTFGDIHSFCGYSYERSSILTGINTHRLASYEPRHFKGMPDEFPQLLAYGRKIDALRKKYKNQLWYTEFLGMYDAGINVKEGVGKSEDFRNQ